MNTQDLEKLLKYLRELLSVVTIIFSDGKTISDYLFIFDSVNRQSNDKIIFTVYNTDFTVDQIEKIVIDSSKISILLK